MPERQGTSALRSPVAVASAIVCGVYHDVGGEMGKAERAGAASGDLKSGKRKTTPDHRAERLGSDRGRPLEEACDVVRQATRPHQDVGIEALFNDEGLREIETAKLVPSSFDAQGERRERFDEGDDEELARSVLHQGMLMPLLVRPFKGDHFEIVAGERRWRAAIAAGLEHVPCLVRALDDEDAVLAQLAENLQRTRLDPLAESRGYAALRQAGLSGGEIAKRLGRSRSVVYDRLKLIDLGSEARAALLDGRLSASTARLVARLPEDLQAEAIEETVGYDGQPLEVEHARLALEAEFVHDLEKAPFDVADETLPGSGRHGSCQGCRWRNGNQCANRACFAKRTEFWCERALDEHDGPVCRLTSGQGHEFAFEGDWRYQEIEDLPQPTLCLLPADGPRGVATIRQGWKRDELDKLLPKRDTEEQRRRRAASRQRYLERVFSELKRLRPWPDMAEIATALIDASGSSAKENAARACASMFDCNAADVAAEVRRRLCELAPDTPLPTALASYVAEIAYHGEKTVHSWQDPKTVGKLLEARALSAGVDLDACKRTAAQEGRSEKK